MTLSIKKQAQIYLASNSPRRQELLQQMGVEFKVISQFAEEKHQLNETPEDFVSRLAMAKASDGLARLNKQNIPVLGSDTAVILDGRILGKPTDREEAIEMLLSLSNRSHQVLTAVALKNEFQSAQLISTTEVSFAKLTPEMCENYWQTGEPIDKAGSYGIQGRGALFIHHINGSYSGVMGLPIYETRMLLQKFNLSLL
jgi:septum formation protein